MSRIRISISPTLSLDGCKKHPNQIRHRYPIFPVLTWFPAARFTLSPFQSTKRRSDSQTNVPWNFISRRIASVGAYILRAPIVTGGRGGIERKGGSIPQLSGHPSLERGALREKEKQRRWLARFSIIRIYGNSVHVTPDNFRNGLLDESFTSRARAGGNLPR